MEWRTLNVDNRYSISEYGDVKNDLTGCILKCNINKKGYKRIDISYKKSLLIHRLVYSHFVGELKPDLVIDHIDGNKHNNHYTNLQQITSKANTQRGNRCRHIIVVDKCGNTIYFPSVTELCKYLNYNNGKGTNYVWNSNKFKNNFVSYKEVSTHTYEN